MVCMHAGKQTGMGAAERAHIDALLQQYQREEAEAGGGAEPLTVQGAHGRAAGQSAVLLAFACRTPCIVCCSNGKG